MNESMVKTIVEIPLSDIVKGKNLTRLYPVPQEDIDKLADSIKSAGLANPLQVEGPDGDGKYNLLCGENRYRALIGIAKKNGADLTVTCSVEKPKDDAERIRIGAAENIRRKNLSVVEIAALIKTMRGTDGWNGDGGFAQIGKDLGLSEERVRELNRINGLPRKLRKRLHDGLLNVDAAFVLNDPLLSKDKDEKLRDEIILDAYKIDLADKRKALLDAEKDHEALQSKADKIAAKKPSTQAGKEKKKASLDEVKTARATAWKAASRAKKVIAGLEKEISKLEQSPMTAAAAEVAGADTTQAEPGTKKKGKRIAPTTKAVRAAAAKKGVVSQSVKPRTIRETIELFQTMATPGLVDEKVSQFAQAMIEWFGAGDRKQPITSKQLIERIQTIFPQVDDADMDEE